MNPSVVSFAACPDYGLALAPALEQLLAHHGGWRALVQPGQRVLVKPNLLADATPEQAVTTHPEVVRHVLRGLRQAGAVVQVGDSPASAMTVERVWQKSGIGEVCQSEQVPLLTFEQGGLRQIERDGFTFGVAKAAYESDLIINLPKVKTHALTTLTAAVKNFYGLLPGYQKAQLHKAYPKPSHFCRLLRALHAALPPNFSIADGIVGMEGEGPANGKPVPLGFLAASRDAVALDLALCQTLRIDPRRVPYLTDRAHLPPVACFERRGDTPCLTRDLDIPTGAGHMLQLLPESLVRLVAPLVWVRPTFNRRCVGCGRCVAACPAQALRVTKGSLPVLQAKRCIACCCCHEVCPVHAIRMQRSPLLRLLGTFRELS
jgi:uncharacterized protein (DUF362 family)/Pyruvate/2-oxoacid:ferredoxin oxidoreductase delta subunit